VVLSLLLLCRLLQHDGSTPGSGSEEQICHWFCPCSLDFGQASALATAAAAQLRPRPTQPVGRRLWCPATTLVRRAAKRKTLFIIRHNSDLRGSQLEQGQTTRMYGEVIGFCCSALTDPRR
jgi:hypothetical protein